jgi:hypothetical protein
MSHRRYIGKRASAPTTHAAAGTIVFGVYITFVNCIEDSKHGPAVPSSKYPGQYTNISMLFKNLTGEQLISEERTPAHPDFDMTQTPNGFGAAGHSKGDQSIGRLKPTPSRFTDPCGTDGPRSHGNVVRSDTPFQTNSRMGCTEEATFNTVSSDLRMGIIRR